VIPLQVADAGTLLEDGLALLDGLMEDPTPTLRWYRSSSTAVVLGRGQRSLVMADASGPTSALPIVERHSGGGAVLMDPGLLSLDVVVPAGHPLAAGELGAVFDRVGAIWRAALADLGVPGLNVHRGPATARRRGSPRERLLAAICYATLGRGEVLVGGRKLVGLSQRRRRHGALVQCGLLRRWDPTPLLELFAAATGPDLSPGELAVLRHAAVGLDELMGAGAPDDEAVMAAVQRHLACTAAERRRQGP